MSDYESAVYVWSVVAAAGLVLPLLALAVTETFRTVDCLGKEREPSSRPSIPHSSAPSHPGY